MPITREDVEKIAELARLELTPEETDSFTQQLAAILSYTEKLSELDTQGVEPMSHSASPTESSEQSRQSDYSRRDDLPRPSLGQQTATGNAPDPQGGYFRVPKVIGG